MQKLRTGTLLLAVTLAVIGACSLDSAMAPAGQPAKGRGILFVGNSLTYVNDLPAMLAALADSAGGKRLAVESVAFPDFALEDHWAEGSALKAIRRGGWEVVVLQQGSSALPENRASLRQWGATYAAEIRKVNAKPAFYMVWPQSDRQFDFQNVIDSYTLAASDVDGLLFPVGAAWLAVWKRDPSVQLYSPDGLHPSVAATYLAAAVIYAKLYDRTPVGLPAALHLSTGANVSVPRALAAILQAAAAEVTLSQVPVARLR